MPVRKFGINNKIKTKPNLIQPIIRTSHSIFLTIKNYTNEKILTSDIIE